MPRSKFNKSQNNLKKELRKLVHQIVDKDKERAKNNLMSNVFFKLKVDDDGTISLDENYQPGPVQVSEDGITQEERQLYGIPDDYMVGETEADGSCLLNSFLIGLQATGVFANLSMTVLRSICAHVGRETPPWLGHALSYKYLINNYTRLETPEDFVNRVLYDDSWGEPEIEGRILCGFFSVSVYILEADGIHLVTGEGMTSVTDVKFHRPNTLYFINRGRYHYEPLLPINSDKIPTKDDINKNSSQKVKDCASTPSIQSSSNSSSKPLTSNQNNKTIKLKPQQQGRISPLISNSKSSVPGPPLLVDGSSNSQNLNHKDSTSTQPDADKVDDISVQDPLQTLDDKSMTPEFKQILEAIKAKNVQQLEAAFINHRNVLYKSTPDVGLMTLSLKEALSSSEIRILDLVYEHWTAVAHILSSHHVYNLKRLSKAMVAARDSCLKILKEDRQMLVAQHCLIAYNNFRVQLCRELISFRELTTDSDDQIDKQQQILDILIVAIDTYKDYSDKNIKSTNFELIDELVYESFTDETNEIYRLYLLHDMFELYYCKLDLCVASLILEYIDSTDLRLKLAEKDFREIECALYYYINRVKDNWRPYVPDKINKLKYMLFEDFYDFLMNPYRVFNCLAIYLERMKFRENMDRFRINLKYASKLIYFQEPVIEMEKMMLLPYLRDKYFLEKMVKYLEVCSKMMQRWQSKDCLLVIQRVLKVIGVCLENTEHPLSLSILAQALLHAHIPHTVFCQLIALREYLSDFSNENLIRIIKLEETHPDLLLELVKDLDGIKRAVIEVLDIYKPLVERDFFSNSQRLVTNRINELLYNNLLEKIIQELFALSKEELINIVKGGNNYVRELLSKYGFTFELFQELVILILNKKHLKRELHAKKMNVLKNIIKQLPIIIKYIENTINDIESDITADGANDPNNYEVLKNDTKKQTNLQPNASKKLNFRTAISLINLIANEIIPYTIKEEGEKDLVLQLSKIFNAWIDKENLNNVRKVIVILQEEYETIGDIYELDKPPKPKEQKTYEYKGIEQLTRLLMKKVLLTEREIQYLKENIDTDSIEGEKSTHLPVLDKIFKGEEISSEERAAVLNKIGVNNRCKVLIGNLVGGRKRDKCVLQYLAIRASALKNTVAGHDFTQLIQRYKVDEGFRILVEALLQDIYNVYCEYGLQHDLDVNMTELFKNRLHDFLDLTNPILELIIKTDSRLATFFRFALNVVEDEPVFKELWQLQVDGLGIEEVKRKWSGPESPRLQNYFKLLPQTVSVEQSSFESRNFNKDNTETVLLEPSKSAEIITSSSMPATSTSTLVQTTGIAKASLKINTPSESVASLSIASLSAVISCTSAAAEAAVSAASAASAAAQAAAAASEALASLISSLKTTSCANGQATSSQNQT